MLKVFSAVVAFFLALQVLHWAGLMPKWFIWFHGMASIVSFCLFAWDKWLAVKQRFRVAESTLLLSALLGGWPGAWLARGLFRHKTLKKPFIQTMWGCSFLHLLLLLCVVVYQLGLL